MDTYYLNQVGEHYAALVNQCFRVPKVPSRVLAALGALQHRPRNSKIGNSLETALTIIQTISTAEQIHKETVKLNNFEDQRRSTTTP